MSVQLVVLLPALFAVMFLGMQAALYYQARAIAIAAAQEGARTAGAEHGSASAGIGTARAYVLATGGDTLTEAVVTGFRTATVAAITVRGTALSVLPGWRLTVEQTASLPVERIT